MTFDITTPFPWGKHKGTLCGTVIEEEPSYIEWMLEHTEHTEHTLTEEALAYLEEQP